MELLTDEQKQCLYHFIKDMETELYCYGVFTKRSDVLKVYQEYYEEIDKLKLAYCFERFATVFSLVEHVVTVFVNENLKYNADLRRFENPIK